MSRSHDKWETWLSWFFFFKLIFNFFFGFM